MTDNPMVSLNISDVEEMGIVPEGQIQVQILGVRLKETRNGKLMFSIRMEPLDSDMMVDDIFDNIFLPDPDATKKQNNRSKLNLKSFCDACGVELPSGDFDPDEVFTGCTPWVLVGEQPHYQTGKPSNFIKQYIVE